MPELDFEWDEDKRLLVLEKHGIDFKGAVRIFKGPVISARSAFKEEERWIAIGLYKGLEIAVIYTMRGKTLRIITARRARTNERQAYHKTYPDIRSGG